MKTKFVMAVLSFSCFALYANEAVNLNLPAEFTYKVSEVGLKQEVSHLSISDKISLTKRNEQNPLPINAAKDAVNLGLAPSWVNGIRHGEPLNLASREMGGSSDFQQFGYSSFRVIPKPQDR